MSKPLQPTQSTFVGPARPRSPPLPDRTSLVRAFAATSDSSCAGPLLCRRCNHQESVDQTSLLELIAEQRAKLRHQPHPSRFVSIPAPPANHVSSIPLRLQFELRLPLRLTIPGRVLPPIAVSVSPARESQEDQLQQKIDSEPHPFLLLRARPWLVVRSPLEQLLLESV